LDNFWKSMKLICRWGNLDRYVRAVATCRFLLSRVK
jgi:hypothetical protein